ncbi:MAG: DUF1924 domain-containing protein [Gammaproteobacteria bacterium]|nr:DUF1924 domain-containing protein [Gammaproteobacteria bacterium]
MKSHIVIITSLFMLPISFSMADSKTVENLIQSYIAKGAASPSIEQGKQLWQKTFTGKGEFPERSCVSCHTDDLTALGKHVKTNKTIKPMAPSANPERLTSSRKVEKWFKRNCKWTLGRECTAQEKANILLYINNPIRF